MTARAAAGSAHWYWDRDQYDRAAERFLEAAELARQEAAGRPAGARPDQSPSYRVRAGLCLHKAGHHDRARPLLEGAVGFDWRAARLLADAHMTEHALVSLMEEAAGRGDVGSFRALWRRALGRCDELGWRFPRVHPFQDLLLDLTMRLGERDLCRHVVEVVKAQRGPRLPRSVRAKVALAEAFLSGG